MKCFFEKRDEPGGLAAQALYPVLYSGKFICSAPLAESTSERVCQWARDNSCKRACAVALDRHRRRSLGSGPLPTDARALREGHGSGGSEPADAGAAPAPRRQRARHGPGPRVAVPRGRARRGEAHHHGLRAGLIDNVRRAGKKKYMQFVCFFPITVFGLSLCYNCQKQPRLLSLLVHCRKKIPYQCD